VRAALEAGISDNPAPTNPALRERQVFAGPGTYYYLGGAFISFSMGTGPSGAIPTAVADIKPQMNNGVITSVTANGTKLEGPTLDLRSADLPIGQGASTWTSGDSSATLLVQSAGGNLIRVCWDVDLPAAQRVERLKRTMCGVYDVNQPGKDVGGYLRDTIGSGVIVYTGTW
jgi:hypothetical protein